MFPLACSWWFMIQQYGCVLQCLWHRRGRLLYLCKQPAFTSLNSSSFPIDVEMMCAVCRRVFFLTLQKGRCFPDLQKTSVQFLTWASTAEQALRCGSHMKHSPGGTLVVPHTPKYLCKNAWEPLRWGRASVSGELCPCE